MKTFLSEIQVLGHIIKVTPNAKMICGHSPDEDDFLKRWIANTVTIHTRDVAWEISAIATDINPNRVTVDIRSKGHKFNNENLALRLEVDAGIDQMYYQSFDEQIIRAFDEYQEAQYLLIEHIRS